MVTFGAAAAAGAAVAGGATRPSATTTPITAACGTRRGILPVIDFSSSDDRADGEPCGGGRHDNGSGALGEARGASDVRRPEGLVRGERRQRGQRTAEPEAGPQKQPGQWSVRGAEQQH